MPSSDNLIPVIDISRLAAGEPAGEREVARVIGEACRGIGFFYITGHGVPRDTLQSVFDATAEFFQGPAQLKEELAFSGPGGNRGFIRLGDEALDPGKPTDVKEAFNIGLELSLDDPDLVAKKP